jgi:hypothetical protein
MMKYLIAMLYATLLFSCTSSHNSEIGEINTTLASLKDNQAKIELEIDGKQFYAETSVFQGSGYVDERGIKISLKDQSMGNVIVSLEGNSWFKNKPYKIEFKDGYPTSSTMGSFLMGKINNTSENRGEGYVLYNGFFEIKYISKDAFVVYVKGNLKKPFGDDLLSNVEGNIIWKNPDYNLEAGKGFEIPLNKK